MERLSVDLRVPGVALISLSGEHELYGAPGLEDRIESLLATEHSIVIDLTNAIFLDSSIVGVLLNVQKLAASCGRDFSIVLGDSTGESVRKMFDITGLSTILPIVERDSEAEGPPPYSSSDVSSPGSRFSSGGNTLRA